MVEKRYYPNWGQLFNRDSKKSLRMELTMTACLTASTVASIARTPLEASSSTECMVFNNDETFVTMVCEERKQEKDLLLSSLHCRLFRQFNSRLEVENMIFLLST